MVKPILEITKITKKISKLDFSEKYISKSKDEIGLLGENINIITDALDRTINDLKSTNIKLNNEMDLQKRFLASVSHEFKTPVGLIRGYAETIKFSMLKTEKEKTEVTDIIINEADNLSLLVKDIMLLMHMNSASFVIEVKQVNINELIDNTIKRFAISLKEKEVNLILNYSEHLDVECDQMRISQALMNYISNAIRYVDYNGTLTFNVNKVN